MTSFSDKMIKNREIQEETTPNCVVSTVPAEGLAPLGARPLVGKVLTKSKSHIYKGPAL